jgi:hypothetical protein
MTGSSLPEYFRLVDSLFDLVLREADRRIDSAGVGMICCFSVAINDGLLMCHRLVREAGELLGYNFALRRRPLVKDLRRDPQLGGKPAKVGRFHAEPHSSNLEPLVVNSSLLGHHVM